MEPAHKNLNTLDKYFKPKKPQVTLMQIRPESGLVSRFDDVLNKRGKRRIEVLTALMEFYCDTYG